MGKRISAATPHHEREVEELRADHELAVEYLKAAMESLDDPDARAAGLASPALMIIGEVARAAEAGLVMQARRIYVAA